MIYHPETHQIETQRLILRNLRESDLQDFYDFAKDPEVGPRTGWAPHKNIEESKSIADNFIKKPLYFAITLKGEDKFIGSIEAMTCREQFPDTTKLIGYCLRSDQWGYGYMTEACRAVVDYCFDVLGCQMLFCGYFEPNKASAHVQEKCGFSLDGRTRMFTRWIDGTVCDRMDTSLSREKWSVISSH